MSKKFKQIQYWFKAGMWSIEKVGDAVTKGWITAEEYELITGEPYAPAE